MLSFEKDGSVTSFDGNYSEYHDWKLSGNESGLSGKPRISAPVLSEPGAVATGLSTTLSKNQRTQLEKRIKSIESEIPPLEAEVARLTLEMSDPRIASDYSRLADVNRKLSETEARIRSLYEEWETAADQLT